MKAGAEIGALSELALIGRPLRVEPVERGEAGADAPRVVEPWSEPPGRDDLVADIFVDFAAALGDAARHVGDEAVEELQIAEFAQSLGDGGRGAHVDEQERPLLDARLVIAPRGECEEHAGPRRSLTLKSRLAPTTNESENSKSAPPIPANPPEQELSDHDGGEHNDADVENRAQREIGQKRQRANEPAGVAPQHKSFEREEAGRHQGADHCAGRRGSVSDSGIERADQQAAEDDAPEQRAKDRLAPRQVTDTRRTAVHHVSVGPEQPGIYVTDLTDDMGDTILVSFSSAAASSERR